MMGCSVVVIVVASKYNYYVTAMPASLSQTPAILTPVRMVLDVFSVVLLSHVPVLWATRDPCVLHLLLQSVPMLSVTLSIAHPSL